MTDHEKKKINDKKYNIKNTIIAIVGVILIAILFITGIDTKALEYYSFAEITVGEFTRTDSGNYATYYKSSSWDFIASGDNYLEGYIIVKGDIPTHNVISFVDYQGTTHIVGDLTKVTDYSTEKWNIYAMGTTYSNYTHYIRSITMSLNVTDEFDSMWFLINSAVDYSANYQLMQTRVDTLNSPDYISHVSTISGATEITINQYTYNEPVIISDNLHTNDSKQLIIKGECVVTDAPIHYRYSVYNISKGELYNNKPTTLSIATIQYINANHPDVFTNFNLSGAGYEFIIDLSEYDVGDNVIISISAQNIDNFLSNIIILENVIISGEIDSETETESPDFDDNSQYEQGYKDALTQLSKTPLFNATVEGTVVIRDTTTGEETTSIIEQTISILTNAGGYKLGSIDGSLSIIKENNPDKDVYLKSLKITFNRDFVFTNGLVWFGSPYAIPAFDTSGNEGYVSYYKPQITIRGKYEQGIYFTSDAYYYTVSPLDNLVGAESPYLYEMRVTDSDKLGLLNSIEFTNIGTDLYDSFKNSIIYIPYNNYIKVEDAESYGHIMGWYKGWQQGLKSQSNVSYQKGFAEGEKKVTDEAFTNGYNKGLEDANSLRTVILAPFDGITNLMTGMLNVNILGFNLLDLIGGLLMSLLVIWVARRVL